MAVTSTNRIAGPFVGTGATTVFPFNFKVFTTADLLVLAVNAIGTAVVLALGVDYTATLNGSQDTSPGGTITLTAALASGSRMTITSGMEVLQEVILTNLGGFFPEVLNTVFDRLTILVQQAQQGVDQSLKLGLTDDLSSVELPPAVTRAGGVLAFDLNGAIAVMPQEAFRGPTGPTGTTTYDGSNGPFQVNGNLGGKSIVGELMASGFATIEMPNSGFAAALAALPAQGPGAATMDRSYTGNDVYPEFEYSDYIGTRSLLYPNNSLLSDRRTRNTTLAFNLPGVNKAAQRSFFYKGNVDASALAYNVHEALDFTHVGPGSYFGQGNETVNKNLTMKALFAGKSISQNESSLISKAGIGDLTCKESYVDVWGGAINGDDETDKGESFEMREGSQPSQSDPGNLPVKVITRIYTGFDGVQMFNCSNGANSSGDQLGSGRYAVRVADQSGADQALATLTVTANNNNQGDNYSTLTVTEAIPQNMLCAAFGKSAPFAVPVNQDQPQQVTVAVTIQGGVRAAGFLPGIASMNGPRRNERVLITQVSGQASSGTQTLTMMIRTDPAGISGGSNPQAQAYFFQDQRITDGQPATQGFSQTVLRFAAWSKGPGKYSQNIPLCAALDAHTLVYASNSVQGRSPIPGYQETIPQSYTNIKMGRLNNQLFIFNDFINQFYGNPSLIISGCSDPSFNVAGQLYQSGQTFYGEPRLGFANAGPNVGIDGNGNQNDALLVTGTFSFDTGRNVIKVYHAAEVIRVSDPTAFVDVYGTVFGLESNDIAWAQGDVVEFPGHYSTGMVLSTRVLGTAQPTGSGVTKGTEEYYYGPGVDGFFVAEIRNNPNLLTDYKFLGGLRDAPVLRNIQGPWGVLYRFNGFMPACRVFDIQAADRNNPNAKGDFLQFQNRNSNSFWTLDAYNEQMEMGIDNYGPSIKWTRSVDSSGNDRSTLQFTGPTDFQNHPASNLANGVNAQDAVTLQQLQAAVPAGLSATINFPGNAAGSQNLTFTNGVLTARS